MNSGFRTRKIDPARGQVDGILRQRRTVRVPETTVEPEQDHCSNNWIGFHGHCHRLVFRGDRHRRSGQSIKNLLCLVDTEKLEPRLVRAFRNRLRGWTVKRLAVTDRFFDEPVVEGKFEDNPAVIHFVLECDGARVFASDFRRASKSSGLRSSTRLSRPKCSIRSSDVR